MQFCFAENETDRGNRA